MTNETKHAGTSRTTHRIVALLLAPLFLLACCDGDGGAVLPSITFDAAGPMDARVHSDAPAPSADTLTDVPNPPGNVLVVETAPAETGSACWESGWCARGPRLPVYSWSFVWADSVERYRALGEAGTLLSRSPGGPGWRVTRDADRGRPADVHTNAFDDVWAVGREGRVERWDGQSWRRLETDVAWDLTAVGGSGSDDIWVFGAEYRDVGEFAHERTDRFLRWDGASWTVYPVADAAPMTDVVAVGRDDAWAVGSRDVRTGCVWLRHEAVALRWDGVAWQVATVLPDAAFTAVWVDEPGTIWLAGETARVAPDSPGVPTLWRRAADAAGSTGGADAWEIVWQGTEGDRVAALTGQGVDGVWGVTVLGSLLRWQDGSLRLDRLPLGPLERLQNLALTPDGGAVVVGPWGVIFTYDGHAWTRWQDDNLSGSTTAAHVDGEGVLRVAGATGTRPRESFVARWMDDEGGRWIDEPALGPGTVTLLSGDGAGRLWAAGWVQEEERPFALRDARDRSSTERWREVATPPGAPAGLYATGDETAWLAVLAPEQNLTHGAGQGAGSQLVRWDGAVWRTAWEASDIRLTDLRGWDPMDIWAAGDATPGTADGHTASFVHFDGETWIRIDTEHDLVGARLWGDGHGDLWAFGSSCGDATGCRGAVLRWDGASWSRVDLGRTPAKLPRFLAVTGRAASDLWLSTEKGLYHFDGAQVTPVTPGPWGGYASLATSADGVWFVEDHYRLFRPHATGATDWRIPVPR